MTQLAQLRQLGKEFAAQDASIVCVLPFDSVRAKAYKKARAFDTFQTLADPSGRVCSEYGVADQLMVHSEWVSAPSVFVIDKKGNIAWSHRGISYDDRPSAQDVLARVRAANGR